MITSRRQRAVLSLLALNAGSVVSADQLHAWLWDDEPPATALKTLQTYLYRVRQAIGPESIESRSGGYALRLPPDAVDALRFEDIAASGLRQLEAGDAVAAAHLLRRSLEEWRGAPLSDAAGSYTADATITRLLELRFAAQDALTEARLQLGEHLQLVPELEQAVSEAPLREHRWQQLARALHASGRRADALRACDRARRVLVEHAGVEPGPALQAYERHLLSTSGGDASDPSSRRGAPIPSPVADVVGREEELDRLLSLLERHRLVTVVGPGGAGKTTLVRLARSRLDPGACYADLDRLPRGAPVDSTVLSAVGGGDVPGSDPGETLLATLGSAEHLLVLDCCEHVMASVVALVGRVLASCEQVFVLCTSRERLGLPSEAVLGLGPLPAHDAQELYRRRAVAAGAPLPPQPLIELLCTQLDQLPLAIELAAAMGTALSPEVLLERLAGEGDLDAGGATRDRHRSVAATIEWSCALLSDDELSTLLWMGAFAGAFDIDAATRLATAGGVGDETGLSAIVKLVRRSLIVAEDVERRGRYHLLASVRAYARRRLRELGQADAASEAHLAWVLATVDQMVPDLGGPDQARCFPRLERVAAELPVAFEWASRDRSRAALALPAATGLFHWWMASGRRSEGTRWIATLARSATDLPRIDRVRALFHAALMAAIAQLDTRPLLATDAMRIAEGEPDAVLLARLLDATLAAFRDDLERSAVLLELSTQIPAGMVAPPLERYGLFVHHANRGDVGTARAVARSMVDVCLAAGDEHLAGGFIGALVGCIDDDEEARSLVAESRRIAEDAGCSSCLAQAMAWEVNERMVDAPLPHLAAAASLAGATGDTAKVVVVSTSAIRALAEAGRDEDAMVLAAAVESTLARARFRVGLPRRQIAVDEGRRLAGSRLDHVTSRRALHRGRQLSPLDMVALLVEAAALPPRYRRPARSTQ